MTQSKIKNLLDYDPMTGIFTRLTSGFGSKSNVEPGWINDQGYKLVTIENKTYRAHRLAWLYMYGVWPSGQIDHIDHNRSNNSISNLRDVTHQDNHKNKPLQKNNKSGTHGVSLLKNGKWRSRIKINGKEKHLGFFNSKKEAVESRLNAEIKYGFHINHGH